MIKDADACEILYRSVADMAADIALTNIKDSINKSVALPKCRKCGCLGESLDGVKAALLASYREDFSELLNEVEAAINKMEPSEYT